MVGPRRSPVRVGLASFEAEARLLSRFPACPTVRIRACSGSRSSPSSPNLAADRAGECLGDFCQLRALSLARELGASASCFDAQDNHLAAKRPKRQLRAAQAEGSSESVCLALRKRPTSGTGTRAFRFAGEGEQTPRRPDASTSSTAGAVFHGALRRLSRRRPGCCAASGVVASCRVSMHCSDGGYRSGHICGISVTRGRGPISDWREAT